MGTFVIWTGGLFKRNVSKTTFQSFWHIVIVLKFFEGYSWLFLLGLFPYMAAILIPCKLTLKESASFIWRSGDTVCLQDKTSHSYIDHELHGSTKLQWKRWVVKIFCYFLFNGIKETLSDQFNVKCRTF